MRLVLLLPTAALAVTGVAGNAVAQATLPTVQVTGHSARATPSALGFGETPLHEAPASVHVIGAKTLQAPGVNTLSRILETDTSVGQSYAIAGYYENFSVRGFTLDHASSYRINGFLVPGELDIALDNKASVELLKGVGTLAGGAVSPGGVVNFIAKRPANITELRTEAHSRGGLYTGLDLGRTGLLDGRLGLRLNLAHEELRPDATAAHGRRDFGSLGLDFQATPQLLLQADLEGGHRRQPAVPGFQLLGGTVLPPHVDPRTNINRQPWSRPTTNDGHFASLRADWQASDTLRVGAGISDALARIEDNLATPSGCNTAPVQYFCGDGGYVLYDYHASERRRTQQAEAHVAGRLATGDFTHAWTVGTEATLRRIQQWDLWSTTRYDDAGLALSGNLYDTTQPLPAPDPAPAGVPRRRAWQQSVYASDEIAWGRLRATLGTRVARAEVSSAPGQGTARTYALPFAALAWLVAPGERYYVQAARGLDLGSEAPLTAENAGVLLPPRVTKQVELGWRREWHAGHALSLAAFRMQRPYDATDPVGNSFAGLGNYRRAGKQVHAGIEAHGRVRWGALDLGAGATWLRARAEDTEVSAYDGVQVQNVPRLRSRVDVRYAVPSTAVTLNGALMQVGARNARRDGLARAPGYTTLDVGASWRCDCVGGAGSTLSVGIRNLTDRRYWRDVGEAYSADLLFPGNPRSVAVSLVVTGR